jgi:citrate synthase
VGTENEHAIDISKLRAQTGFITLDDAYVNTGATTSAITYLDGEQGVLRYRGYPIEVLAQKCDFVETSYLLIYGELPTREQLDKFRTSLQRHTMIHEDMRSFYNGFPRDAHPMAILGSVVGALSTFYQDSLDPHDSRLVEISVHRLMAKLPTIAAYSYKKSIGQPFVYPRNDQSYCENFLHMMFAVPTEPYKVDPDFVEAITSRIAAPPPCEWSAPATPTSSLRSRLEFPPCGGPCMAARIRPASKCSRRSAPMLATLKSMSRWPKRRTPDSA